MKHTREHIFYELLQSWRADEDSIIAERSHDIEADTIEANREMLRWLERYDEAPSEPGMLGRFKQCVIDAIADSVKAARL